MKIKNKKNLLRFGIIMLIVIQISTIVFMYRKSENDNVILDDVNIKNNMEDNILAIMLETGYETDEYDLADLTSWPTTGYRFNKEKSGCINKNGSTVEDGLIYNSVYNYAEVETGEACNCYLYFDKVYTLSELCDNGDQLGSCLTTNNSKIINLNDSAEGGLYRYQGTHDEVNDNYVCFGTTNKSTCTSNTDAYMYRIIGIDSSGQVKLIKKEALNETLQWHSSKASDTNWSASTLYSSINGNKYLTNETYMPSGWEDRIALYNWKHGVLTSRSTTSTAKSIYDIENAWSSTVPAKIGLLYMHDYFYGLSGGNNCYAANFNGVPDLCKTSWIYLWHESNDDSAPNSTYEWIMTRYGYYSSTSYTIWIIHNDGALKHYNTENTYSVRPVFYLNASEVYAGGNGTITDPIILSAS